MESWPQHSGETSSPLTSVMGKLVPMDGPRRAGSAPRLRGWAQWPRLISSPTIQTYILGLGLSHPKSSPIYALLECAKGPVPQNNNCRTYMTGAATGRISDSSDDGPVMMIYQKPEALN